jgi:hypothetical protein
MCRQIGRIAGSLPAFSGVLRAFDRAAFLIGETFAIQAARCILRARIVLEAVPASAGVPVSGIVRVDSRERPLMRRVTSASLHREPSRN